MEEINQQIDTQNNTLNRLKQSNLREREKSKFYRLKYQ